MPSPGWLRRVDLPLDAGGRRYIDPDNLDQILDQFANWRDNVNGGGHVLSNVSLDPTARTNIQTPWSSNISGGGFNLSYCSQITAGPVDGSGLQILYDATNTRGVIQCWSGAWRQIAVLGFDGEALVVKNATDTGHLGLGFSSSLNAALISSYNAGWKPLYLNSGAAGAYVVISAPPAAPADVALTAGTAVMWLDESSGTLKFKVKYQNTTVHSGSVTLT